MQSRFHQELDQLKHTILQMAMMTEQALRMSVRALLERDNELGAMVVGNDQEINLLEVAVDKQSLRLLALDQPLARDLRFIVGCMRIAVELERIADLAVNIARRVQFLNGRPPLPANSALELLADTTLEMLRTVIAAFINENADQAGEVCQMDDTADALNMAILKNLLDHMVHEVSEMERSVQLIIVARCLERAADQTTNIAESIIFIVKGVNIKHRSMQL